MPVDPIVRRRHIAALIKNGDPMTIATRRSLATHFNCSVSAIYVDVRICLGGKSAAEWKAYEQVMAQNKRCARLGIAGTLDVVEWRKYCASVGYRCVRCGSNDVLTIDHIIPVSKGGTNTMDNVQLLCLSCNCSKRDRI